MLNLRTVLSIMVASDIYALPLKFLRIYEVLGPLAKLRFFLLNLRTFLSIFGATNVYALPLKFLKSLPADFFPHLV